MPHRPFMLLVACALIGIMPGRAAEAPATKIRVLVLTGGHGFDREPFLDVFRANRAITFTHLEHTKGMADAWDRAELSNCDVVVLYDMPPNITEEQRQRFLSLFDRGTGLVVLHHALVSYQDWPDYERIIGGRYIDLPEKGGDPKAKRSGYQHDVDIPVRIAAANHPVTAGVAPFTIRDEIYWDYRTRADITPLLTTSHPKSGNPIAWTRMEKRSRVVYLLLGHGPSAYSDPNYRRLLANAIRWTAGP